MTKTRSGDGYLVDQTRMQGIPYGGRASDANGCGWVAAYNFLRANGSHMPEERVRAALERFLLWGGVFGTSPLALWHYLRKQGYLLRWAVRPVSADALSCRSRAGILMYWTGRGAHFVAFQSCGGGTLRFWNTSPAEPDHRETMKSFLQRHSRFPLVILLAEEETAAPARTR